MATGSLHAPGTSVTLRVPFAASSVALARRRLRTWMSREGWAAHQVEDAQVILSELLANSIRHARPLTSGAVVVRWYVDNGGLHLCVTDGGSPSRPRTVDASPSALEGRGMAIVDRLAHRWWSERSRSDSTVHALLRPA